jgi:hypothetical protein
MQILDHKGLGDTIETALKITGIHYIANAISNGSPIEPCKPCIERKHKLNKKVPYGTRKNS